MRILVLFLAGFFLIQLASAQDFSPAESEIDTTLSDLPGKLNVDRDPRLDQMLEWQIEKNREREGMDGYRVEIFFSSSMDAMEQAQKIKVNFLKAYPDYPVHIRFIAPNFRVRVGDFRTKNEAWKLYRQVQKDYPTAFVVPDVINFPLLKQEIYE